MGINQVEVDTHWNYFLSLEEDFLRVSRYVHFNISNNKTHSIEFARIILSVGSEVDVVAKGISKEITGKATENIKEHMSTLMSKFPDIPKHKVFMDRFGMDVVPWENWENNKSPDWWHSYNNVKHNRGKHFQEANLENTFRAIAGLFILLVYYLRGMGADIVRPSPSLLSTDEALTNFDIDTRSRIFILYSFDVFMEKRRNKSK